MQAGGLPNRDVMSGQHLTRHNLEVMSRVIGLITTALSVCVSTDGWTGITSNGLHNFMVGNSIPYLLKSIQTHSGHEDVQMLYGIALDMKFQIVVIPNSNKGVRLKISADLRTDSSKT
eukprot:10218691-Ditylum_brightwellii.AAC.1